MTFLQTDLPKDAEADVPVQWREDARAYNWIFIFYFYLTEILISIDWAKLGQAKT